jgi:hypothetical protein
MHLILRAKRGIIPIEVGMIGFDGEGWSWIAGRGAWTS